MTLDHASRAHAKYSPSASHRFLGHYPEYLGCTAAPRVEAGIESEGHSEAAAEGTLCHEICEAYVRHRVLKETTPAQFRRELMRLSNKPLYDEEMKDCAKEYAEYIMDCVALYKDEAFVLVEERLDLSVWLPDSFGTADCVIICEDELTVIDYKQGMGPVSADHNTQLMLYALGAYEAYRFMYDIKRVNVCVFQPRIDNVNAWECSIEELLEFGMRVNSIVDSMLESGGEFRPSEDGCRFCKAKGLCRARAEENMKLYGFITQSPDLLKPEEIGEYLSKSRDLANWVNALEDEALKRCLNGQDVPGYKAVRGKSRRKFKDTDKAYAYLSTKGYDKALLYESKPITLTECEKLVGKSEFNELMKDYIIKPEGAPTLVPESDKREAINKAKDLFKED